MDKLDTEYYALKYWGNGLLPIPVNIEFANDKKIPKFLVKWSNIKEFPDKGTIISMFHGKSCGIGVVCGALSGNLTLIDFDRDVYPDEDRILKKYNLWQSAVRTKHGYHFHFHGEVSYTSNSGVGNQVDIKSNGGISFFPPTSYYADGKVFEYIQLYDDFYIPYLTKRQASMLFNELGLKVKNEYSRVNTQDKVALGENVYKNEIFRTFKPLFVDSNYEEASFAVAGYLMRLGYPENTVKQSLILLNTSDNYNGKDYIKPIDNVIKEVYHSDSKKRGLPSIVGMVSKLNLPKIVSDSISTFDKIHRIPVADVVTTTIDNTSMDVPINLRQYFHKDKIRIAQLDLLNKIMKSTAKNIVLKAPTGVGKTEVYLSFARHIGGKTVIVVPDRALQDQLVRGYGVTNIKGKANYVCGKYPEQDAETSDCNFEANHVCSGNCQWAEAKRKAASSDIIACNFGNYKQYVDNGTLVIFDEFHKIIKELSNPVTIPLGKDLSYISTHLSAMEGELDRMRNELDGGAFPKELKQEYIRLSREKQKYEFLLENIEHCYTYSKNNKTFIKVDESGLFLSMLRNPEHQLFVSATPLSVEGNYELIQTTESVINVHNAPIVYYPITNMSRSSISERSFMQIAQFIDISMHIGGKAIVHTGNIEYAHILGKMLSKYYVKIHERGKLDEVMADFKNGNYDILLTASGDAGFDFYGDTFKQQFIVKVPYPARDEEWAGLGGKIGYGEMNSKYIKTTIDLLVQICGRIARGSDDTGITYILDNKFQDLYIGNKSAFGDISNRILDLSGKLGYDTLVLMAMNSFGQYKSGEKFTANIDTALRYINEGKVSIVA